MRVKNANNFWGWDKFFIKDKFPKNVTTKDLRVHSAVCPQTHRTHERRRRSCVYYLFFSYKVLFRIKIKFPLVPFSKNGPKLKNFWKHFLGKACKVPRMYYCITMKLYTKNSHCCSFTLSAGIQIFFVSRDCHIPAIFGQHLISNFISVFFTQNKINLRQQLN